MALPPQLEGRLALPAIAAPMFLVSGPDLVTAVCKGGIIGGFPALNQRTSEGFEGWLDEIEGRLGTGDAPHAVNLIVHHTNPRVEADLAICERHEVPVVITSLGAIADLVDRVHAWGGVVFHDVVNLRHARKAAAAGVDGLILVAAGAGGHAGTMNPFALVSEVRAFFDGTIILAGAISDGRGIAAAEVMGADLAYLGTRFIATKESLATDDYKRMIVDSTAADIVYTPAVSGIPGSFLRDSLSRAGIDPEDPTAKAVDMGAELDSESKAWKHIWSAGQGVGGIDDIPDTAALIARLKAEYAEALAGLGARAARPAAE